MSDTKLVFYVNGCKVEECDPDPEVTLLQYLRKKLRLTGSKLACGEGGCGACTVMVSRYDTHTDTISHFSVNACLAPVCSLHGLAVTTVEGIGSTRTRLHPVQELLAKAHGTQCGFCTPGMVMSMYALLRNNPQPTREQIEDNFDGNLCRCTGYRPILEGFSSFSKGICAMGEDCCSAKSQKKDAEVSDLENIKSGNTNGVEGTPLYDPSQEPIFPPDLKINCQKYLKSLKFSTSRVTWYRPVTLEELYDLYSAFPKATLVIGSTKVATETKILNMEYPIRIAATHINELNKVEMSANGITLGASVTLATMNTVLKKAVEDLPENKTRSFIAFIEMLKGFVGHQIRNVASIGGNIITASPASDLNPLLMAAGATLTVGSKGQSPRTVAMDGDLLKGYRKTAIDPKEIMLSVFIPYTMKNEYFRGFKPTHRKDNLVATVNAGMRVRFQEGSDIVEDISLAYGGMAPTTVLALKTMTGLKQQKWNDDLLTKACDLLASDLPLTPDSPGGMVEYRRTLTTSFFFKFYTDVKQKLHMEAPSVYGDIVDDVHRGLSEGVQVYEPVADDQNPDDAVGRPLVHTSAFQQTTGEAIFVEDLPMIDGELYAAVVLSTKAHARIVSVDASEALRMLGIVDFISFKDIPGYTRVGLQTQEEQEIFASKEVVYAGQIIGCILGETHNEAKRAAVKVHIEYEDLKPIVTIEEAIEAESFLGPPICQENGDLDLGFRESDHVIEGEIHIGPQEHFYLETQAVAVRPTNEEGGMEIISNSQYPSGMQHEVAATLGVQANKIVSRVKRIGGGFGGKETNTSLLALPVAVCAAKVNRPVRCMLDRHEDMVITGGRHAFLAKYKVGFTDTGLIKAIDLNLFANCGPTLDVSKAVVESAVINSDGAYNISTVRTKGHMCKTNIPSATACRGFGIPQSMLVKETIMDSVAEFLKKPPNEIRQASLYHEGDLTFYGQEVKNANIRKLWDQCLVQSDYLDRQRQVDEFNSKHRWKKRGIAMIPTKFPLSFPSGANFLNQAYALVTLYMDGSVLVAHCGTEMGQGLHTKMIQVTSRALRIPTSQIYIHDTCTDKMPQTAPTASSVNSDLNGGAVMNACEIITKRLEPFRQANPEGSFKDWVNAAYFDRVSLSATGYYRLEGLDHDRIKNRGTVYNYFTCGVGCSEVEIDCLTGDHQVLRTDIVMDVGKSLNPAIDIGQIEGAFMQGYGLFLIEQHRINPSGSILTRGPGAYKIPAVKNIPLNLNITLLKDSGNTKAVYSSKGIGEPPLILASSVFFAVKDAIKSARKDAGHSRDFRLDSPATAERIRMACQDQFTKQFPAPTDKSYTPWSVEL